MKQLNVCFSTNWWCFVSLLTFAVKNSINDYFVLIHKLEAFFMPIVYWWWVMWFALGDVDVMRQLMRSQKNVVTKLYLSIIQLLERKRTDFYFRVAPWSRPFHGRPDDQTCRWHVLGKKHSSRILNDVIQYGTNENEIARFPWNLIQRFVLLLNDRKAEHPKTAFWLRSCTCDALCIYLKKEPSKWCQQQQLLVVNIHACYFKRQIGESPKRPNRTEKTRNLVLWWKSCEKFSKPHGHQTDNQTASLAKALWAIWLS